MKEIQKYEIRMMKFNKYIYLITSLILFIVSIISKQEKLGMVSIFFIQPIFVFGVMNLFVNLKVFDFYFLHRAQRTKKNDKKMILGNELLAFMVIFIQASFFRSITWYNIIIVIALGFVFEYLRDLVKVIELKDKKRKHLS